MNTANKYKNVPPHDPIPLRMDPVIGMDIDMQMKWDIPDTVIIQACPTGGPIKRAKNPNQPYTVDEIRKSAMECIEAGATSVHIHARADDGGGIIGDIDECIRKMHQIIDPIKAKYGDTVLIDGSELTRPTFEEEMKLIEAGLSEICPINPPFSPIKLMQAEAYYAMEHGVKPAVAIYDLGSLDLVRIYLIETGILKPPIYFGLLPAMGIGTHPFYDVIDYAQYIISAIKLIRELDPTAYISVPNSGRAAHYMAVMAITFGLGLRVGMEDTYFMYPHKDEIIPSSVKVVSDMITISNLMGRRVATADEFRERLGLKKKIKK